MFLGRWEIDDFLTFPANTHDPSDGSASDADSVPNYRIYEDETGTAILTGTMAKLDDANTTGFYSEQVQLTAANGFEVDKTYTVYISATVSSTTGTMSHSFQVKARELATVPGEPTAVFSWSTGTVEEIIAYLGALARNKVTQTATTKTLRNDADNADIGSATTSHDGTTFTRGEFS